MWGDLSETRWHFVDNWSKSKARVKDGEFVDLLVADLFQRKDIELDMPVLVKDLRSMRKENEQKPSGGKRGAEGGESSAAKRSKRASVPPPPEGWGGAFDVDGDL